jgi:DNA-binding CsgD family transcriptional regulator
MFKLLNVDSLGSANFLIYICLNKDLKFCQFSPSFNPDISVFMSSQLQKYQQMFHSLLQTIQFVEEDLDYGVIDKHIPHLEELDRLGKSAISVFDLYKKTHVYTSPSYKNRLGLPDEMYGGAEGFERLMHPEDHLIATEAGYFFMKMVLNMDEKELHYFKLINDFRIQKNNVNVRNSDKQDVNWIRMTEQHSVLETDKHGNIWLALSMINVSPDQNIETPMRSRLVNQKTEEMIDFPGLNKSPLLSLSAREAEVLKLISYGYNSKKIAEKLYISVHTVNTHRQNIIDKLNVNTTTEAIGLASKFGMLY